METTHENGKALATVAKGAAVQRQEFGGSQIAPMAETAAIAMAAQARAEVEARSIVAMRNPRSVDVVRVKLLEECKRSRFASVARYSVPRGGQSITGWSIRFAEACQRTMGNLYSHAATVYDDERKRIVRVAVMDLETNATFSQDVTIDKTVERRFLKGGQTAIASRINSSGQMVHVVEASDDDLLMKQNALTSKALRNMILRLVPGDVLDECLDEVDHTMKRADSQDPAAARKKLIDAFAAQGVMPDELETYLGHPLASCSPAELQRLRELYAAIREGATTWAAVLEERAVATQQQAAPAATRSPQTLADVALQRKSRKADAAPPPTAVEHTPQHDPLTGEVVPPPSED